MTAHRLREMRLNFFPDVLFLMETKNQDEYVLRVLQWMGYAHSFTVPPSGQSGGLALFWKHDVDLEILSSSINFIDTRVKVKSKLFLLTLVYGDPVKENRSAVWNQVTSLRSDSEDAWLLAGDFNDLLDNSEKRGGPPRHQGSFIEFRSFVSKNGLWDLKFSGNPLSWRGMRYEHFVRQRLDRAMSNNSWLESFPSSRSEYLRYEGSDHRPLVIFIDESRVKKRGQFRFDNRLRENEEIHSLIQDTWEGAGDISVLSKINKCRQEIINWTKVQNINSAKVIKDTQLALEEALSADSPEPIIIGELSAKLEHAYKLEEQFWKQRSRIQWLHSGDRNTGYFHAVTRNRRFQNRLTVLEDSSGTPCHEEHQISQIISDYFQQIFSSETNGDLSVVLEAIEPCVSQANNEMLTRIPTDEEIKAVVFSIHAGKAPGPDGFTAGFYHAYWHIISLDVSREIRLFFTSSCFPRRMNETHIRLIPKDLGPRKVADYRPIALCNIFYKIVAKIITTRMQQILPNLISENQSAFVPGRAISDNVLITHEILHYLLISSARKYGSMAIKTDMSKAYDRVEWDFLKAVLSKFGFHETFIAWILECVTSVSYSFLINGSPQGRVLPSRGLRQGDPLSPYLFILCTEVLSGLCKKAQVLKQLSGIRVSQNGPRVNHLLFADDTMFFAKADAKSCAKLSEILSRYGKASGQSINLHKSSITFSARTSNRVKGRVKRSLKITKEGGTGKYLGLPEHFGQRKRDIFGAIADKIRQKAHSWASRFLSAAGKQIMLKSVLAAMPQYAMSCFKLPISLCKKFQSLLTRFWWDDKPDKRKTAWVAWSKLTAPKNAGGLGFRDIERCNDSLLAKLGWRILNNPDSLLARILTSKYCKDSSFMECQIAPRPSHGWRGLMAGRELLRQGLGWLVVNGEKVSIWNEPWLSISKPITPIGPAPREVKDFRVSHLIDHELKQWDWARIQQILPGYERLIRQLPVPSSRGADKLVWLPVKSGLYTAKSGYGLASLDVVPAPQAQFNWQANLWKLHTLPKIKNFLWKAAAGALPVGEQLVRRHIAPSWDCKRCGAPESTNHMLFHCVFAAQVWELGPIQMDDITTGSTLLEALVVLKKSVVLPPIGIHTATLFPWICWHIWKAINHLIFKDTHFSAIETITKAIQDALAWQSAQLALPKPRLGTAPLPSSSTQVHGFSCFVDAAWQFQSSLAGSGWVFQSASSSEKELTTCKGYMENAS